MIRNPLVDRALLRVEQDEPVAELGLDVDTIVPAADEHRGLDEPVGDGPRERVRVDHPVPRPRVGRRSQPDQGDRIEVANRIREHLRPLLVDVVFVRDHHEVLAGSQVLVEVDPQPLLVAARATSQVRRGPDELLDVEHEQLDDLGIGQGRPHTPSREVLGRDDDRDVVHAGGHRLPDGRACSC